MTPLFGIKIERRGLWLYAGWWAARVSLSRRGRFGNGSRWFSGWHRFPEPEDF